MSETRETLEVYAVPPGTRIRVAGNHSCMQQDELVKEKILLLKHIAKLKTEIGEIKLVLESQDLRLAQYIKELESVSLVLESL
jgi:hypothetical protein